MKKLDWYNGSWELEIDGKMYVWVSSVNGVNEGFTIKEYVDLLKEVPGHVLFERVSYFEKWIRGTKDHPKINIVKFIQRIGGHDTPLYKIELVEQYSDPFDNLQFFK